MTESEKNPYKDTGTCKECGEKIQWTRRLGGGDYGYSAYFVTCKNHWVRNDSQVKWDKKEEK
jgi:RNA polymerase-binding transcription factor DksA